MQAFPNVIFSYSCAAADNISMDSVLRGPSAIAELLVSYNSHKNQS